MAHVDTPSRSRIAWPHRTPPDQTTLPVLVADKRKTHRRQWAAIVVLYLVLLLTDYLVVLDHQYVLGRGQYRDAEVARVQAQTTEQIRQAMCGLLDGLPAGPLLDGKRVEYGCGPGIPLDQLPPEAQQQLQQFSSGITPLEPAPAVKPDRPAQAPQETPAAPSPTASAPPVVAAPTPGLPPVAPAAPVAPTPAPVQPAPLVDVTPLTDTVCTLLGVCL